MVRTDKSLKEIVIEQTKATGILPCIKLKQKDDFLAYAKGELAPSGSVVSDSLLVIVLSNAKDGAFIGLDLIKIAGNLDYIRISFLKQKRKQ